MCGESETQLIATDERLSVSYEDKGVLAANSDGSVYESCYWEIKAEEWTWRNGGDLIFQFETIERADVWIF